MKKLLFASAIFVMHLLLYSCEVDKGKCTFDDKEENLDNALNAYLSNTSVANCEALRSAAVKLGHAISDCDEYAGEYDEQSLQAWQSMDCTEPGGGNNNSGDTPGNNTETGRVTFWASAKKIVDGCGEVVSIKIYINGQNPNNPVMIAPNRLVPTSCEGHDGKSANYTTLAIGVHTYYAVRVCGKTKREWNGTFVITSNNCTVVELE